MAHKSCETELSKHRRTNIPWFFSHIEPEKVDLIESADRLLVTRGYGKCLWGKR
jgi:hypothetical protein